MDKKPKARGAPRKAKQQKLDDKEQSERFIQTARELGADETGENLEIAAKIILRKKFLENNS